MRRYDDPVEVRRGGDGPEQFLWRGRLWKVRAVLAQWVETGPWWQQQADGASDQVGEQVGEQSMVPIGDLLQERELWRVEAGRGLAAADAEAGRSGVFDLAFDWTDGHWQLVGCVD